MPRTLDESNLVANYRNSTMEKSFIISLNLKIMLVVIVNSFFQQIIELSQTTHPTISYNSIFFVNVP